MDFFLSSPELSVSESNILRVNARLTNGSIEILDFHQDLLGKISTDAVQIETMKDNVLQKSTFLLQNAVFVVSKVNSRNLNNSSTQQKKGSSVTVYARRTKDVSKEKSSTTLESSKKEYLEKKIALEKEEETMKNTAKIFLLKQDIQFLEKVISEITNLK